MSQPIPVDLSAERALIGAMLIRPQIAGDVRTLVDPSDLFTTTNQATYAAILDLWDAGAHIDAITVAAKTGRDIGDVNDYTVDTPASSAWRSYADLIIDASRRRRIITSAHELSKRAFDPNDPVDEILSDADLVAADRLIASRVAALPDLYDVLEVRLLAEEQNDRHPWIIPGLLKPHWRVILVGPEGMGKGTLLRQVALHAAAGRDPFAPNEGIEPVPTLYVDAENSITTISHQFRIANRQHGVDVQMEASGNLHVWHREAGLNLRSRSEQAQFEAAVQRTKPKLICAGPLYKLFRRQGSEDLEQATLDVLLFLDDLRARHGCAILVEHHLPKAQGMYRSKDPFGSAVLKRWPEIGLSLEPIGTYTDDTDAMHWKLGRFRGDREPSNWPDELTRDHPSGVLAWTGTWTRGR